MYIKFKKKKLRKKMSSGTVKNDVQNFVLESQYNESLIGISESTIPFMSLSNNNKNEDIYSDTKNIKFSELNPEFKHILKQEFLDAILSLKNDLQQK
jgi:hypothetical protein